MGVVVDVTLEHLADAGDDHTVLGLPVDAAEGAHDPGAGIVEEAVLVFAVLVE